MDVKIKIMKKRIVTLVGGLVLAAMLIAGSFYLSQVDKNMKADQFDPQKTVAVIP